MAPLPPSAPPSLRGPAVLASRWPHAAATPAARVAPAPATPRARRCGCPGQGSSRRVGSRTPSHAHRGIEPTSGPQADHGRCRSATASRWPDRATFAPTRSHSRAYLPGRPPPPERPARPAGSRRHSNGSGGAERVTQAIATAPERPLPEGDRLAATAAMAGMADADAAKAMGVGCGLPVGHPCRRHSWRGRCRGRVPADLQAVLADQATGQESAGARLLQVRRGAHGHQLADLLRCPICRCAVDHALFVNQISLASLCRLE